MSIFDWGTTTAEKKKPSNSGGIFDWSKTSTPATPEQKPSVQKALNDLPGINRIFTPEEKVKYSSNSKVNEVVRSLPDKLGDIGNKIGGTENLFAGSFAKGFGDFVDFVGGNTARELNKLAPKVFGGQPNMPLNEFQKSTQNIENQQGDIATKLKLSPEYQQKIKTIGEFIGSQTIPTILSDGLTDVLGAGISKIPLGKDILSILKEASGPTAPFIQRYGITGAKNIVTGAIASLALNNKKPIIENAIENAGMFAAFHAVGYPIAELFRPIFKSVGTSTHVPDNTRKLANEALNKMEGQTVQKTLYFKNPADETQILKVTATGIKPISSTDLVGEGVNVIDIPTITKYDLEAFKKSPSMYERLSTWVKGKLEPNVEIKFNKTEKTPGVSPVKEDIQSLASQFKPKEEGLFKISKQEPSIPKEMESLAVEARKYKSAEEFVKAQETKSPDYAVGGGSGHTAPLRNGENAPAFELTKLYPNDIYSTQAEKLYSSGYPVADKKAISILQSIKDNPNADITIYRAVPKGKGITEFNKGDWITLTREYAKDHGESNLGGNYEILSKKVKSDEIFTDANSIQEFGYDPRSLTKSQLTDFYNKAVQKTKSGALSPNEAKNFNKEIKYTPEQTKMNSELRELSNDHTLPIEEKTKRFTELSQKIKDSLTPEQNAILDENFKKADNVEYERTRSTLNKLSQAERNNSRDITNGNEPTGLNKISAGEIPNERSVRRDTGYTNKGDNGKPRLSKGDIVDIDENTFKVLKEAKLPTQFISKLKTAFDKGAVKKLALRNEIKTKSGEIIPIDAMYRGDGVLFVNPGVMNTHSAFIDGSIIDHELNGHSWYLQLSPEGKLQFYTALKSSKDILLQSWKDVKLDHKFYWEKTIVNIKSKVTANSSLEVADSILNQIGLKYDPEVTLDTFIDRSLNLDKTIEAINRELVNKGYIGIFLKAENTIAIMEHNAVLAENNKNLILDNSTVVGKYIDDIQNETLEFGPDAMNKLILPEEVPELTTSILEKLKGRETVSKQFISDLTNSGELKQVERDITRQVLDTMPDGQINVKEFADKVKSELLPLNIRGEKMTEKVAKAKMKELGLSIENDMSGEGTLVDKNGEWVDYNELPKSTQRVVDAYTGNARSYGELPGNTKYESVSLPAEQRGNVKNYKENIYESPIKTSAGSTHFGGATDNYFGHTRIEDMADNKTRRVIEVQSDLYQKGRLEDEMNLKRGDKVYGKQGGKYGVNDYYKVVSGKYEPNNPNSKIMVQSPMGHTPIEKYSSELKLSPEVQSRITEQSKLQQYNDPTAHFRMVREEIKKASQDGKTKLQFPTGETAMKVEGLGGRENEGNWRVAPYEQDLLSINQPEHIKVDDLKVGQTIYQIDTAWIITDVLGDGKFKAVPKENVIKDKVEDIAKVLPNHEIKTIEIGGVKHGYIENNAETFDISGKVDTNNPIYKFYEKDLGRYLKNKYDAKPVTDDKGVTWNEVTIKPEMGEEPVMAFRVSGENSELARLRAEKEKAQQQLDMATGNSEIFGDKIPALKAKVDALSKQIMEAKYPPTNTAQEALKQAEKRIGLERQLNRQKLSLEAAQANPEAHAKAYGEDRIPQYKEKINQIQAKIDESTTKKLLKVPSVRVSGKDIQLSEDLYNRKLELDMKREELDQSDYKQLMKYIAQSGNFEGHLPEVLGAKGLQSDDYKRIKNKNVKRWIREGDSIIQGIFGAGKTYAEAPDSETIREGMDKYLDQVEELRKQSKQLNSDINTYITSKKDEIALEKISEANAIIENKTMTREEKLKALAEAQKRVNAEEAKKQDKRMKIEAEKAKAIDSREISKLNPKSSLDPETRKIYEKFSNAMNEAKIVPLKYANKLPAIDKMGVKAFYDYETSYAPWGQEIKERFDALYEYARKNGFPELAYQERYLPHIYGNTDKQIREATMKALAKKGMTDGEIIAYMNGTKLSPDRSVHLKVNPFFEKYRIFKTYEEARMFGLKPKYDKISDLLGAYERLLLQTSAARNFIDDLAEAGKIVVERIAPMDWQPIKYGPAGIKGYWASPKVGNFIDNLFQGLEDQGLFGKFVHRIAELNKFGQNIALSGGAPFTSVNFFTMGIVNKELMRGNLKAFKAFITANSDKATIQSLQNDYKYIEMMARNGIPFRSIAGVPQETYETIKTKWGNLKTSIKEKPLSPSSYSGFFEIVGEGVDKVFGKKTFDNFLPLLYTQVFKDSYLSLIKSGMSDTQAQVMAANLTRLSQGIMEDVGRSQKTQDELTALFFAPVYRESIINVLTNTAKSVTTQIKNPMYNYNRKLLAGLIIAFGVYQLLNKKLNGQYTWQNPQNHEADLRIPLSNGQIAYVPFMPGFMALPRTIIGGANGLLQGDVNKAFEKLGTSFSMVLKTTLDVLTNTNYFGDPIYKDTDTRAEKIAKIGSYIGLEFNHPYVKELVKQISGNTKPLYQSMITATELPIKFSTQSKEDLSDFYNSLAEKAVANAKINKKYRAIYENVQTLVNEGKPDEALAIIKALKPDELKEYKQILTAEKAKKTKEAEARMLPIAKKIQKLVNEGKKEEALKIIQDMTPEEKRIYALTKKLVNPK